MITVQRKDNLQPISLYLHHHAISQGQNSLRVKKVCSYLLKYVFVEFLQHKPTKQGI